MKVFFVHMKKKKKKKNKKKKKIFFFKIKKKKKKKNHLICKILWKPYLQWLGLGYYTLFFAFVKDLQFPL